MHFSTNSTQRLPCFRKRKFLIFCTVCCRICFLLKFAFVRLSVSDITSLDGYVFSAAMYLFSISCILYCHPRFMFAFVSVSGVCPRPRISEDPIREGTNTIERCQLVCQQLRRVSLVFVYVLAGLRLQLPTSTCTSCS